VTVRRIRRRIRRRERGIDLNADVDATIAVNRGERGARSSVSSRQRIVQRSGRRRGDTPEKEVKEDG
jgi:hypothetical protein